MIFSIDSFVHPCRQICTCNQSPVDSGLITVLIWHPAAFLVLIWTCAANLGGGSGGVAELKMSYGCCSYCVQSGGDEAEKKGFWGLKVRRTINRRKTASPVTSSIIGDSSRLCHVGRYHCLLNPQRACRDLWHLLFLNRDMQELSAAAEPPNIRRERQNELLGSLKVDEFALKRENKDTGEVDVSVLNGWKGTCGLWRKEHTTFTAWIKLE